MFDKKIYFDDDADISCLKNQTVAIIGYGNQGRAQALNLRDSNVNVIIGTIADKNKVKAASDGFEVYSITQAVKKADIVFILTPDEEMPKLFKNYIQPFLKKNATINFASGYNLAFNLIQPPIDKNVIMIAPRMIGVGVRERYKSGEGFYSFISVYNDADGNAHNLTLALAKAIGTLKAGAIVTTVKEEAILDLFNEQAFGPAFGQVLLSSIKTLLKNGLPPEAVLCEMYLSGEMSYTYRKMAQIGLIKQTNFHSHTSQYGAMSRGIRYMDLKLEKKFQKTIDEIKSGDFAKEWSNPLTKLKFKIIKYFAMNQPINKIENKVRKNLKLNNIKIDASTDDIDDIKGILKNSKIETEINIIKELYDYDL